MLPDPLIVGVHDSTAPSGVSGLGTITPVAFHSVGSVGVGSSVRTGTMLGCKAKLSINHSSSKENAPYDTNRSVIRLDLQKVDTAGRTVTMSVYQVTALPQGGLFTEAEMQAAARTLDLLTFLGDVDSNGDFIVSMENILQRVIAGEP